MFNPSILQGSQSSASCCFRHRKEHRGARPNAHSHCFRAAAPSFAPRRRFSSARPAPPRPHRGAAHAGLELGRNEIPSHASHECRVESRGDASSRCAFAPRTVAIDPGADVARFGLNAAGAFGCGTRPTRQIFPASRWQPRRTYRSRDRLEAVHRMNAHAGTRHRRR
jgi:hypothetical protein